MAWKGNPQGRILVIQDEPSQSDIEQGTPFTGPPGWKLKDWINGAGLQLNDVMFCNLDYYNFVDLASFGVVVPVGEKSTETLLPGYPKLNKIRGSIYYKNRLKIIPSLHPKDVIFNTQWEYRCRSDWKKIKEELDNGIWESPIRSHNIAPDLTDIKTFLESLRHDSTVSMDIETWGGTIKCIGFAANERESLVIPTEESYWAKRTGDELDIHNAWDMIQQICTHPCAKIMQNGLFDAWWLEEYGISVENYIYDTLAMHHALWPRDNHSLDYLASLYTRQPYWKDEAKDADEIVRVAKQGMEKLYVYNGLDVTVTHEIWQKIQAELVEAGLTEFYKTHYAEMFQPLLSLMRRGISVDRSGMDELRVRLVADAIELRDRASQLAGEPLYIFNKTKCERDMLRYLQTTEVIPGYTLRSLVFDSLMGEGHKEETIDRKWAELQEKGISDTCLIKVLEEWELPKAATGQTKTGRVKVDNISLRKIQKYYEDRKTVDAVGAKVREIINITLDHRRKRKLASFLTDSKIDDDARLRCTYKFTTKTGRLASSKNPRNTGMNLQNIDRELRHLFTASKDRVLLEIDLSRAENRVVGVLTGDSDMIEAARRPTTGTDVYKERTAGIYSELWQKEVTIDEVTSEMRRLGKEVVLAVPYGMKGQTFSDRILKKLGITITPKEATALLEADLRKQPAIRAWQSEVRKIIWRDRYLCTSWGSSVDFLYDRFDDETYRFAYSAVPQGEIGRLCNQWMVKPVYEIIKEHKLKSELILQCHDAIIVDAYPEEVWHIMRYVKRCVERPRIYGQSFGRAVELLVPCEYTIGPTWKHYKDWKSLPSKEEVADVCKEILK